MSLIMDALKKAQQLRLKEPEKISFPTHSPSGHKRILRALGRRWIIVSTALLIAFSLIFWGRLFPPPSSPIPIGITARLESKSVTPMAKEKPQASSKEALSPEFIEGLKDAQSLPKDVPGLPRDALSLSKDVPGLPQAVLSLPKAEKPMADPPTSPKVESPGKENPPIREKREEPPIKKAEMPPSPVPPKEQTLAQSIAVKQEGEKDRSLDAEILTHFNLGVKCYNQREFSKAIQAYQRVIELDPTYVEAYNNLGIIYQEIRDFNKAFEAYQKSIEINPRYEKGYNNLGILLYLKGRPEEALEAFQKALAINARNIESHINLGVLYKKQGQLNKAIESYGKALDINPLHRESHFNIALLYEEMKNVELAIDHYQQFITLSPASGSDLVPKVQRHVENLIKLRNQKK